MGQGAGRVADAPALAADVSAESAEEIVFQLHQALLGPQHPAFVLLQPGGGEALGSHQGLLAFIVGGHQSQVGLGDLQVIAEDPVELDLQIGNAGSVAFAGFQLGNGLLPRGAVLAQAVQLGVEPGPNQPALGQHYRRIVVEGLSDLGRHVIQRVAGLLQAAEPGRGERLQSLLESGDLLQRLPERDQVPGVGAGKGHLGGQAFQVIDLLELLPELLPQYQVIGERGHRLLAALDLFQVDFRPQHPGLEEPPPHSGGGFVQAVEQGAVAGPVVERLQQLQVLHRGLVQQHRLVQLVVMQAVQVQQLAPLGLLQVVQGPAGRGYRQVTALTAESIQAGDLEMVGEQSLGKVRGEGPLLHLRLESRQIAGPGGIPVAEAGAPDQLLGPHPFQFRLQHGFPGAVPKLGDSKVAGGNVHRSQAQSGTVRKNGAQEVVFPRLQQVAVAQGAGGDDPGHLPLHQLPGGLGVFDLVADGHPVAFADQLGDIGVGTVVGNPAHGDGGPLFLVARGQGDLQLAGGHHGIVEEHLVEVAQPEEQNGAGNRLLDLMVLGHHGGGGLHAEVR